MVVALALLLTVFFGGGVAMAGTTPPVNSADSDPALESTLVTANPILQASVDRIASQSALWRAAFSLLRGTGRRIKVVTPDHVLVKDERGRQTAFDRDVLAEVFPVRTQDSRVDLVVVVINLEFLYRLYLKATAVPMDLQADLDRVVIHEVYGHALPYLLAGDMSGRCADPMPNERASDACSIKRENEVREELRLGRRTEGGFAGLSLTRRSLF